MKPFFTTRAAMGTCARAHKQYVHRELHIKGVSQSDKKCNRERGREGERAVREWKEQRLWLSSCDIWLDFDTPQSGRRIFPRAARPSDRARASEGVWRSERGGHTHSSPKESARLLRQLKQDDPPTPLNIPPLHHFCLLDHWRLHSTPWLTLILPKMSLHETQPFL